MGEERGCPRDRGPRSRAYLEEASYSARHDCELHNANGYFLEEASHVILSQPERWLPLVAAAVKDTERQLLAEVGFEVAHVRVEKKVEVEFLHLERSPSKVVF